MPQSPAAGKKIRIGKASNKASETIQRYPCSYNIWILSTGLVFMLYMALEHILTSIEWSNRDNYIHQTCRHIKPIDPNLDLSSLSPERKERFKAVQLAVGHAWKGYTNIAALDSILNRGGGSFRMTTSLQCPRGGILGSIMLRRFMIQLTLCTWPI